MRTIRIQKLMLAIKYHVLMLDDDQRLTLMGSAQPIYGATMTLFYDYFEIY